VDGKICQHSSPYFFPDYDGGEISFTQTTTITNSDGKITYNDEELSFANMEEYFDWIREQDKEAGLNEKEIERDILNLTIANEAIKNGTYEEIPEGTVDINDSSLYIKSTEEDYRHVWEYDRESVEEIKDFIEEINIYDEELDTEFLVHVTLPPNYDENKTYPVFFLTDGVWRFGNHPELRKLMENNEADETILVSLGYNYHIDGTHEYNRFNDLVVRRDKLLDFITDNLMPYLGENYNIDYTNSTLYGHSDGGVFTHNALFKSDMYENQPFGNYIIGSPALWGLYNYNESIDNDSEDCKNDYGYYDRNEKLDKSVFLCAGALEDPDYADNYNGHDTTLEGVAKLNERLESHGANVTYKLYDSHHYQFIPEMLCEVLKTYYPA
jgi:predicted alpha/beta superfamily hydrolase